MVARTGFVAGTGLAAGFLALDRAAAQGTEYPSQLIKVIVPFPAGGAVDATMRILEPKLREILGQPIVIVNMAGANGSLGAAEVAKAEPDGHTLLFAPREVYGVNPILQAKPAYDALKDFAPIGIATEAPYVLIAHPGAGTETLKDLIERAKTTSLAYASFGHGSMAQLNIEGLASHFGVRFLHVAYRGAPPAVLAVVTGEAAFSISTPPAAMGFINERKIVALAVGSDRRIDLLPEVPTFAELGHPGDLFVSASFAMVAPARTPAAIVERLSTALRTALGDPQVAQRLNSAGLAVVASTPAEMTRIIQSDIARFGKIIAANAIKAN
jgi:tripartite-type tricarboxylate transporter receptor subunit TctC